MNGKGGHGAKLPRKREQAIAALLNLPTIEEAARAVGIAEATLRRWLKDPAFRSGYQEARRQVTEHATAQLQKLGTAAAATLREIIEDGKASASARVMACRTALELGQRGVEIEDLTARIEALERAAETKGGAVTPIRAAR